MISLYIEPPSTTAELGLSSTIYLDSKQKHNAELSQSTTTTTTNVCLFHINI
jgi:hypothetical protein